MKIDSAGRLIISSVLAFSNISSKSVIRLENLSFKKPFHFTGIPRILWIESCLFNGHYIQSSNNGGYREDKSPLNSRTFIFQDNIVLNSISFFEKNEPNIISVENAAEVLIDYNYFKNESSIEEDSIQYLISLYDVRSITISDNTFNLADVNLMFSNIENIVLDQNNFFGWVNVFGNASGDYWINEEGILEWDNYVSSKIYNFDMVKNNFKGLGLSLSNFKFIETTNFINNDFNNYQFKKLDFGGNLNFDFRQLVDVNISLGNKYLDSSYHAITDHELSQYDPFMELIQFYTLLYRNDKERGNIESANDAYYELSELYTRKYA